MRPPRKRWLTIGLASAAALSLSLYDVSLQKVGGTWDASRFLPVVFLAALVVSLGLLPWIDRPRKLKEQNALEL